MSLRLDAIVMMAPNTQTTADIGCDHGKAGVALLLTGKAKRVIFSDISAKSLEKTRNLVSAEGLLSRSSIRVGNGLSILEEGEAQAAIIAGMGGELIVGILEADKQKSPDILVLSCNTKPETLRRWLCSNGYVIKDEELVAEDGRFYPVILAVRGESGQLGDVEMELGPVLLKKKPEELKRLISIKIMKAIENREKIRRFGTPKAKEKLSELDEKIKIYKEVKEWLLR